MSPYSPRSLDELVEETVAAVSGRPMVFFLGAGASAASPSFLPQPWLIQQEAYRCVAPEAADTSQRELIVNSLPEIYHEVLLELGGERTREIWRVLTMWERPEEAPTLARYGLRPNIVHHLVVYLSWKTGTPVITVNFDNMLERAAETLGLRPDARLDAEPRPDGVAIWKLHGTVERQRSIRTTLQGIVLDLYELVPSPTGACIHYRDVAEALFSAAEEMPTGDERNDTRRRATNCYEEAIEAAKKAGDPSLRIKVMLGWKRADASQAWPAPEVEDLLAGIQSPAFMRYGDRILAQLTRR